jgi:hypothetical protein
MTDYDTLDVEWLHPLSDEPLATGPGGKQTVRLPLPPGGQTLKLPTGTYRLTLKSRGSHRIRDFVLASAVDLRASSSGGGAETNNGISLPLPPSLSGEYIGFAGYVEPRESDPPIGIFCGLRVDLRTNSGELFAAFLPVNQAKNLHFADLKPQQDTIWPLSNLYLEDPARLAFDCPISYVDHRVELDFGDGRAVVTPRVLIPEGDREQRKMWSRMQALLEAQVRDGARRRQLFDPSFSDTSFRRLPAFPILETFDRYASHLATLAATPVSTFELGTVARIRLLGNGDWKAETEFDQTNSR